MPSLPEWSVGDVQARLDAIASRVGRPLRFTPETTLLIVQALQFFQREGLVDRSLSFSVEVHDEDGSVGEHAASAGNLTVARAAYEAVCEVRPGRIVILRQGARVVERRPGKLRAAPRS